MGAFPTKLLSFHAEGMSDASELLEVETALTRVCPALKEGCAEGSLSLRQVPQLFPKPRAVGWCAPVCASAGFSAVGLPAGTPVRSWVVLVN